VDLSLAEAQRGWGKRRREGLTKIVSKNAKDAFNQ